jgi:ribosomal protein L37AE/L43A
VGETVQCGKCKKDLKKGMRFWVCSKCEGECKDPIHPSYIGHQKQVDMEKGAEKEVVVEESEVGRLGKWIGM